MVRRVQPSREVQHQNQTEGSAAEPNMIEKRPAILDGPKHQVGSSTANNCQCEVEQRRPSAQACNTLDQESMKTGVGAVHRPSGPNQDHGIRRHAHQPSSDVSRDKSRDERLHNHGKRDGQKADRQADPRPLERPKGGAGHRERDSCAPVGGPAPFSGAGTPWGSPAWTRRTAQRQGLAWTHRKRGRPTKNEDGSP